MATLSALLITATAFLVAVVAVLGALDSLLDKLTKVVDSLPTSWIRMMSKRRRPPFGVVVKLD